MFDLTMIFRQIFLGVCGLSFGLLSSAGVFTVLVSVGLIPRFAGKMHVAKKVFVLEEAVVLGTIFGGVLSIFFENVSPGKMLLERNLLGENTWQIWRLMGGVILILWGFFAGMFVGCLALSIADLLNSIPIFSRRIGFRHGLGIAITAAAFGKLTGSLIYFAEGIFRSGL